MMPLTKKFGLGKLHNLTVMAGAILLVFIAAGSHAGENNPGNHDLSASLDLPQRQLSVIGQSPVIAAGLRLGTVVVYDDPMTPRPADYLELYDGEGGLVALSWFDRFGIQRIAVDRAFVEGEEKLEGVFVTVIEDSFI